MRRVTVIPVLLAFVAAALLVAGASAAPPTITVPGDMTVEATSSAGADVSYTVTAVNQGGNPVDVECSYPAGTAANGTISVTATFALGDTEVRCTVTESGSVESEASFTVHVVDSTAPVLDLPDPISVEADSSAGATVPYSASSTDAVDGPVQPNCEPASGTVFAVGETTVSCTATDTHGNSVSGSFTVTVTGQAPPHDTSPPDFTNVPGPLSVEAVGPNGATVTYTNPTAKDDVDGPIAVVTCTPASGSTFPIAQTTVQCTASDHAGNQGSTSFTVSVVDTTAPTLSVPGHTSVQALSSNGIAASDTAVAAFLGSALARDLVDASPTVTTDAPATFPVGDTTVTFKARDDAGNTTTKSSTLTVLAPVPTPSPTPTPTPTPTPPPAPAPPPPAPPVVVPPPPDARGFGATAARGRITLRWTLPGSTAVDHVELLRAQASNGVAMTTIYRGMGTTFVDTSVQEGSTYRYQLVSVGATGDRSTGLALTASPLPLRLLAPLPGKALQGPPMLRWLPTSNATYYNLQVYRDGTKVLSIWPTAPRFQMKGTWKYLGRTYRLSAGSYRWYVWAGFGARAAQKYSPLLGQAGFTIRG